jgi:hypothetical protein
MKTTIFQSVICILVIASTIITSCHKVDQIVTGSVSGTISLYDPSTPMVKIPAKGVKLCLIDHKIISDTVNNKDWRKAITDSVITGADGKYLLTKVVFGDYTLMPFPDSNNYRFESADKNKATHFTLDSRTSDYSLDLMAPLSGGINGDLIWLTIGLTINNGTGESFRYIIKRQTLQYIFVVPFIIPILTQIADKGPLSTDQFDSIYEPFGSYYLVGVKTNNFLIDFYYFATDKLYYSAWITWPDISNTPVSSQWEINLKNKTVKRLN